MVVVSERSLEKIISDVAPKVEQLTGWNAHLDSLNLKIIRRSQLWEHSAKVKYDLLGIDAEAKTEKGKKALQATKLIMPYLILAEYEPLSGTMLVVPDNLRFGTNESGISLTIGHELTHRCQFTNNPQFGKMYVSMVRRMFGANAYDDDPSEDKGTAKYLQSYMTLVEGDASFVQSQLKGMYYQDAKNKTSGVSNLIGLVLLLASLGDNNSGFIQKLRQYSKGKNIVRRVYEAGGREKVNAIYSLNERMLHRVIG